MNGISRLLGISLALLSWGEIWALPALAQTLKVSQAASLQSKWKVFKALGIELALPENFVGGSPSSPNLQPLVTQLRILGPQFDSIASVIERNPNAYLLVAVDPKADDAGGVTNAVVAAEQVSATATLNSYLDSVVKQLPGPIKAVERKIVQVGKNPAGRLVTEANWEKGKLKQLLYVIKQGRKIWTIAYSTGEKEYEWRLPMFEQSIAKIKIQAANAPRPVKKK